MDSPELRLLQFIQSVRAGPDVFNRGHEEELYNSFVTNGSAQDLELSGEHAVALFNYMHNSFEEFTSCENGNALKIALEIVATAFSWEFSNGLDVHVTSEVAEGVASAAISCLIVASKLEYETVYRSLRNNMGLVSMVTTREDGPAPAIGTGRIIEVNKKKRLPRWNQLTWLRAVLAWLLSRWTSARPAILLLLTRRLDLISRELKPSHAYAARALMQLIVALVQGQEGGVKHSGIYCGVLNDSCFASTMLCTLDRLRRMPGMVTDTGCVLGIFHDALVEVGNVVIDLHHELLLHMFESIVSAWRLASNNNTPAAILLLHEAQMLVTRCLPSSREQEQARPCDENAEVLGMVRTILPIIEVCVSSDNSMLAQMGLGFFKHAPFVRLLATMPSDDQTVRMLLQALMRDGEKHWNDTVNRQTGASLQALLEACPAAVHGAAEAMFGPGTDIVPVVVDPLGVGWPTEGGHGPARLPRPRLPPSVKFALPLGEDTGTAPVSIASVSIAALPTAIRTNVVCTDGKRGQPPSTITGVAPWAQLPSTGQIGGAKFGSRTDRGATNGSVPVHDPARVQSDAPTDTSKKEEAQGSPLDKLRTYIATLLPPRVSDGTVFGDDQTVNAHVPACLSRTPVYKPTLAFHDLVFGHELGAGAFATVRYAKAVTRGVPDSSWPQYAVKVLPQAVLQEKEYAGSARREVAVLSALCHPNAARMISSFSWCGGVYLVLELGQRGDLHSAIVGMGSLDEHCARWLCAEIIACLSALHAMGLAFADCKPENVVLVEDSAGGLHAKLTDFAACREINEAGRKLLMSANRTLATLRDGSWRRGVDPPPPPAPQIEQEIDEKGGGMEDDRLEGTPEYLPPEAQAGGSGRPSVAWDAYSFGVTLFQCLAGRLPDVLMIWPQAEQVQGQGKVRFHAGKGTGGDTYSDGFPADFPAAAKSLVRSLLHPDPGQRLGGGPTGLREVMSHPWWQPLGVHGGQEDVEVGFHALHTRTAPGLGAGILQPHAHADPAWARRHNSTMWAPLPSSYQHASLKTAQDGMRGRTVIGYSLLELVALDTLPAI